MMNLIAICLVSSLAAAGGVWSPSPSPEKQEEKKEVIVKESNRIVVDEFGQEGKHSTKVSIKPQEHDQYHIPKPAASNIEEKISSTAADALNSAKDKIKEASSVLPNLGQGLSGFKSYDYGHVRGTGAGAGELICDAYGKCKHKIASALEEAKDKVSGVIDEKKEMAYEAKDIVQDAYGKAKVAASEKACEVKEAAKDAYGKSKENIKDAMAVGKTIRKDIVTNVSEEMENVRDSVAEKSKEPKEGTKHAAKRLGQYLYGLLRYMGIPKTQNAVMGVINLLGLSTAYGMSVWVRFVSSYVLAESLPRQQFGIVQSKIYPVYFRAMACSIGLTLLGLIPSLLSSKAGTFQGFILLASIFMVFINSIYLEPLATKVMSERMKVEKEEGRGRESQIGETISEQQTATEPAAEGPATAPENPEQEIRLNERLKKLNTYSSVLNVMSLMCLSWHLVYLSQSLHTTC